MAKAYDDVLDEQLIDMLRQGETSVMEYIMDKYKNLVRKKAKSMYILGGDKDDLIQEGMIGLFKAVRDYDSGRDASFLTFADLCISRQMYTAVSAAGRQKHIPLNSYVSLYAEEDGHMGEENSAILFASLSNVKENPENMFFFFFRVAYLEERIEKELSDFEKQVLDLYMTGMSYSQIAKVLGRDEKSTDNALSRLKSKIKKML